MADLKEPEARKRAQRGPRQPAATLHIPRCTTFCADVTTRATVVPYATAPFVLALGSDALDDHVLGVSCECF